MDAIMECSPSSQEEAFDPSSEYASPAIVSEFVVKVAARCNIDCSYCYWFRDPSVYLRPKLMSEPVADQLLARVKEHIVRHSLSEFSICLHGGEPLLWGRKNVERFANQAHQVAEETGCTIDVKMTTNGVLIDEGWADCFQEHDIGVGISIDGPAHVHDQNRKTFNGGPTHAAVERGIRLMQRRNLSFGVLAVCNPAHSAQEYFDYFANIGVDCYDILWPDANFADRPPGVGQFYRDLFDLWFKANETERTVSIRVVESMVSGLIGGYSGCECVGYGPEEVCVVLTDGSLEPLDVLRIEGDSSTSTACNIFDNALQDVVEEPRWKAVREASLDLCDKCRSCKFMMACGGGYLPHRYSKKNGYDNPSVYCDDLYSTFEHIQNKLQGHMFISKPTGERVRVSDALDRSDPRQ